MSRTDDHSHKLEQLIDRTLRVHPARRAPQGLAVRVLAEIERRAALPWWRSNFTHWPLAARAVFLVASIGFVRLALSAAIWGTAALRSSHIADALNPAVSWLQGHAGIITVGADVGASVVRAVPPDWLYGGIIVAIALYAALFGLGATAYRTLYVNR